MRDLYQKLPHQKDNNLQNSTPNPGVYLGTNAKSTAAQEIRGLQPDTVNQNIWLKDQETGETFPRSINANNELIETFDPVKFRLEKFALQSTARKLLPKSRTAKCLRLRQANQDGIDVFRSIEHKTAHYGGLQTCGSVWACPVCAFKISERRRLEVLSPIDTHKDSGGDVLLLTLTNPHTKGDDLKEMVKAQAKAMSRFTGSRAIKTIWSDIGYIGSIRAWEITHGQINGWHPHFHILLFVDSGVDCKALQSKLYAQWANACRLAGLPIPSELHGLKLDDGSKAAKYVSKWGLDYEMTKGHTKKAKAGGRSPFDLLRSRLYDDDKQAGALFVEFAGVYKGKRQLYWSPGLKAHFEVIEKTDEETAAELDDTAELLGKIEFEEWKLILKYDLRGDVLELARFGWDAVRRLIDSLAVQPITCTNYLI